MEFAEAEKFLKGEDGMQEGKLSPNVAYDFGGQTAMHMAAYNDDIEGVKLLLCYGADKNIKDEDGRTALDCAKQVDAKGVIALLEDHHKELMQILQEYFRSRLLSVSGIRSWILATA